jgi:hypothetical protein
MDMLMEVGMVVEMVDVPAMVEPTSNLDDRRGQRENDNGRQDDRRACGQIGVVAEQKSDV